MSERRSHFLASAPHLEEVVIVLWLLLWLSCVDTQCFHFYRSHCAGSEWTDSCGSGATATTHIVRISSLIVAVRTSIAGVRVL